MRPSGQPLTSSVPLYPGKSPLVPRGGETGPFPSGPPQTRKRTGRSAYPSVLLLNASHTLFDRPKPCATRPRIVFHFIGRGPQGLFRQEPGQRPAFTFTRRKLARAPARLCPASESPLDYPVLQRVEGYDTELPAGSQGIQCFRQKALDGFEFVIDGDPQRLESPGRRMYAKGIPCPGNGFSNNLREIPSCR